jgi:hypothetical protein
MRDKPSPKNASLRIREFFGEKIFSFSIGDLSPGP